jgi:hypothetical protein
MELDLDGRLRIRLRQPLTIIIARAVNATDGTSSHDL